MTLKKRSGLSSEKRINRVPVNAEYQKGGVPRSSLLPRFDVNAGEFFAVAVALEIDVDPVSAPLDYRYSGETGRMFALRVMNRKTVCPAAPSFVT